jgi:hypothetical protein
MWGMRVRFVGSGDAFGSDGRWQTCIGVVPDATDATTMLVDTGWTPSLVDTAAA